MQKNILTYQSTVNHSFSRNRILFGMKLSTWLGIIVSVAISLVLACRNLYIAIDDENYIAYFTYTFDPLSDLKDGWWRFVLNEPLWLSYCSIMGNAFGAEFALRITIFFSSLMFLVASGNLTRGAWLFIFVAFVIDGSLATQMYFNQIRQGFALSIFLTIIACGLTPLWGAVVASMVHSSFLLVIPFLLIALIIRKFNINWIIAIIIVIISFFLIKSVAPDIDLGRRSETYEFKSDLTIFFYLISVIQYGSILLFFFRQKYFYDETQLFWLHLTLIFFLFVILMTFIYEASGRLMYLENAFMIIVIGLNFERKQVKVIAMFWLLLLLALNLNEARKVSDIHSDTFFDRLEIILNVK
jgi:EpsG family